MKAINGANPEPSGDSGTEESKFDVRLYLHIVRRRLWVLLVALAVALGVAVFLTSRMPNRYRAAATLVVDQKASSILGQKVQSFDGDTGWWQGTTFLKTQLDILKSRRIGRLAAEKLKPELRARLIGKPDTAAASEEDLNKAAEIVNGMKRIVPAKESRKFTVSAVHTDPELAAAVTNAVVDAYVAYSLARRQDSSTVAEAWLSARLDTLEDELKGAEEKLHDFRAKNNLLSISLQDQVSGLAGRIVGFNKKLDELLVKRIELVAEIHQLKRLRTNDPANDPSILMFKTPVLEELKKAYAEQYRKLVSLRGEYLEKHPKIQAQEAVLESIRREMQREAALALIVKNATLRVVVASETSVRQALRTAEKEALALGAKSLEFKRMERVSQQKAKYYDMLLARYVESGLAKKLNTNNVQVLDRALVPKAPFAPRLHVNLGVAAALGLVLGIGLIFLLHFMDNTVKTQEDVEHLVGLPFLGLLPSIASEGKHRRQGAAAEPGAEEGGLPASPDLFQWQNPKSQVAEHCRSIRTNLLFMSPDTPLQALVVTSSVPREGKTTVAINTAISMAQSGERVVLVDTDMRRPRVHKAFGLTPKQGIAEALVGEASFDDIVLETPIENLSVIPCGAMPPNPAELLHTKRFGELLAKLRERFDRIVFDSPPVGAVTDPVILSKAADGTILVVKSGVTARQLLAKTHRVLADVKANVLGAVLNDIDPERRVYGGYYHYYYRRRYYSYYGESDK